MNKTNYYSCRILILVIFGILLLPASRSSAAELTQRDWMITLVDTLGLSFGLPDEPQDPDYINILLGTRTFRYEAEEVYSPDEDEVSLMTFRNFGPYSGKGWLQGLNKITTLHLRFTLPLSGTYQLKASVRKGEYAFSSGPTELKGNGEERFTHITLGSFKLTAGQQEILVTLPPGGAIDFIELVAPALAPIVPKDGWEPDNPLTWEVVQTSLLQAFNLAELLPAERQPEFIEAERLKIEEGSGVAVVSIPHLGKPRSGKWVRAGATEASLVAPFTSQEGGFYRMEFRGMGEKIKATLNDHLAQEFKGNPYLEDFQLGTPFFYKGKNHISFELVPGGGFDSVSLTLLDNSIARTAQILGLAAAGSSPNQAELDHLSRTLAAFGSSR